MKHQAIIETLTLKEKALLMAGKNTWESQDFPEKGIPSIFLADGPHGIRKQLGSADHLGLNESVKATSFPTSATLANSWDVALAQQVGEALGQEARELGVNVLLGPGINIKRSPLTGRNFEYFSEDPVLTGKLAAAMVRGIQSQGVAATPKHYAVNSQELRRMSVDSVLDERTLREIYLRAFEIVVEESDPLFIMTSYNPVNGEYANESQHLLSDILYGEWDYQGAVVTDWGGSNDHVEGVRHGSHLEMPGTVYPGALQLIEAVESGRLDQAILDQRVDELLDVIFKITSEYVSSDQLPLELVDRHHQLAYKAASESIVLLKNDDATLPVRQQDKIAFVGDFADLPRYQGAGSSVVNATQLDTILGVRSDYGFESTPYAQGYHRNGQQDDALVQEAVKLAHKVDKVIVFAGLTEIAESEGMDRTHMQMEANQLSLIDALVATGKDIIIVLSGGSSVEMPFADSVSAIVHTYLSGQAGARAVLDVLTGKVNPSGKLNETYPMTLADTPSYHYFPGKEATAEYREGLYVGYRYYESREIPVRYPFGHGLSYTRFVYEDLMVDAESATLTVTNAGQQDGAEIIQVYANRTSASLFRPAKTLIGFAKVWLKAGDSMRVTVPYVNHSFAFYNPISCDWEVEAGEYTVMVGASVQDIRLESVLTLDGVEVAGIYDQEALAPYFKADVQKVSDAAFAALLNHPLPPSQWDKTAPLGPNDTLSQLFYAKSPAARLVYKLLTHFLYKSIDKGEPNLNLYFNYNMTFRAMQKMTLGAVSTEMVEDILYCVNGHFFTGLGRLVRDYFRNQKRMKREGR